MQFLREGWGSLSTWPTPHCKEGGSVRMFKWGVILGGLWPVIWESLRRFLGPIGVKS